MTPCDAFTWFMMYKSFGWGFAAGLIFLGLVLVGISFLPEWGGPR